ncbi:MAG: hypothetical protein J3K34DRAFT_517018 [Monoraphidium minutum]|nr:MAG: hypothetical protein J3K34DRAFT_517018 [Monoraphidium minutum]
MERRHSGCGHGATPAQRRSARCRPAGGIAAVSQGPPAPPPCHPPALPIIASAAAGPDKKFLSRDEEPEEYWSSKGEREGKSVMSDPLAVIGVLAIFFPFLLLLVAIATGYIDTSVYK